MKRWISLCPSFCWTVDYCVPADYSERVGCNSEEMRLLVDKCPARNDCAVFCRDCRAREESLRVSLCACESVSVGIECNSPSTRRLPGRFSCPVVIDIKTITRNEKKKKDKKNRTKKAPLQTQLTWTSTTSWWSEIAEITLAEFELEGYFVVAPLTMDVVHY